MNCFPAAVRFIRAVISCHGPFIIAGAPCKGCFCCEKVLGSVLMQASFLCPHPPPGSPEFVLREPSGARISPQVLCSCRRGCCEGERAGMWDSTPGAPVPNTEATMQDRPRRPAGWEGSPQGLGWHFDLGPLLQEQPLTASRPVAVVGGTPNEVPSCLLDRCGCRF